MLIHSPAELAEFTRDHRKGLHFSQTEVSDRVGLRQETVSGFENKPDSTKLATLFKLLSALDLELHIVPKSAVSQFRQGWDQEW
ncbi:MAG: helix-turn-helix domain-containing protein [Aphanocapsa sp. GSE-SYN-MK-11-07L]|jgi:HTH-type transcriptional regulator/antitoxin HipB|nr:helix-turn-helix domain-containing protein [Aphanocapsa sp. GSE-SYN-MK-11-07L]